MNTDNEFTLREWLRDRRKALDLTQEALADRAGCSVDMVRRIEAGSARPSRQLAELIANELQLPQGEISGFVQWARTGVRTAERQGEQAPPRAVEATDQPPSSTSAPSAQLRNPYKGLRAFTESDASDFFGRESLTKRLLGRMTDATNGGADSRDSAMEMRRFLAVVGPSGSGKSSVVRAGLVPAIRKGDILPGSENWPVVDVIPGAHPLEEVEAALLRVAVNPPATLLDQLRQDERGLLRAAKRVLPGDDRSGLVLVVDQFEEAFTMVEDEEERTLFLRSLYTAVSDPRSPLLVITTLRADFFDRPLLYADSGEMMRRRTEVVLPMSGDELERAITRPAALVGVTLEQDLLAAMIEDVTEQPGALLLLQYALTELFERRSGTLMTLQAYKESGGVSGALSRRAETIYSQLNEGEQEAARQLFLRLVTPGEGTEDTRRRIRRSEVATAARDEAALERVLELFGRYRLLTFDRDPVMGRPTVEIAHEALIRTWPRLREWLDASRESLRVQRRLLLAANEWAEAGQDSSFLAHGGRLAQFDALQSEGSVALNDQEREYLAASQEAAAGEAAEREERRERDLLAARQLAETQRKAASQLRRRAFILAGTGGAGDGCCGLLFR